MNFLSAALYAFENEANGYIEREKIEAAGDTIKACSVAAAIAGVGAGWLPGAGAVISAGAWVAAIWTMYVKINIDLGISIKRNILKSLASAFLTNILASVGSLILSWFVGFCVSFIPVIGSGMSMGIDCIIGYVTVFASGLLYIKLLTHVLKAKGRIDFSDIDPAEMAKEVIQDSDIKGIVKEAKKEYKSAKDRGEINQPKSRNDKFSESE